MFAEIGENPRVHKELLRNTVEVVTGICDNTAQAMDDLQSTLKSVLPIVRQRGMELFGAGTHPFASWSTQQLTDAPRYAELIKRTQWWGRQMLIWGVHVHVGVSSPDKVMPIMSSLLNWYPHLLALSASSPWWVGDDTGYASNRAMMFQQLPTAGLPFQFEKWAQFERFVHDQKKTGIIEDVNEVRWDVRPSPHNGTLEVRICDGVSNIRRTRRAGRVDALPGGRSRASTGCRGDIADDAAVAQPGKQVARSALRLGLDHHPRRRQQRAPGHRGPRRSADPAGTRCRVAGLRRRAGRGGRHSTARCVLSTSATGRRGARR